MAPKRALILDPKDTVANMLEEAGVGDEIVAHLGDTAVQIRAVERIPFGYKVAIVDLAQGALVYKYGEAIGRASQSIRMGQLVHVHNLEGTRGRGDLTQRN